jgi:hypothetical protein
MMWLAYSALVLVGLSVVYIAWYVHTVNKNL